MSNKEPLNHTTVNTFLDKSTWNDVIYTSYLQSKAKKSQNDIDNDRVMSVEESKERIRKKYANTNDN